MGCGWRGNIATSKFLLARRDHAKISLGYYNAAGRAYSIPFKEVRYIALNVSLLPILDVTPGLPQILWHVF